MKKTMSSADKDYRKLYIHLFIAAILYIAFRFFILTPSETTGLTEVGMKCLAVFIPVCYLWCVTDVLWPSLFAIVMLALDGALTAPQAINYVFGHYYVAMTICMGLVVFSMQKTGLIRRVAQWIISRPVVHGKPYLFLFFFGVATWFVSICINYINAAIIMLAIAREVSDSIEIDRKHSFHKAMLQVVMVTAVVGESTWPFGRAICTIAYNQLLGMGLDFPMTKFLVLGVPFSIITLVLVPLILKWVVKPDVSAYDRYDDAAVRAQLKTTPLTKRAKYVAVLFILLYVGFALPGFIPSSLMLKNLGVGGIAVFVACLGALIRVDGEPLVDLKNGLSQAPWRSALFLGCCFLFVSFFTGEAYGIRTFFAHLLMPLTSKLSPVMLIIAGCVIATIGTNFLSNAVVTVACCAAVLPQLAAKGLSESYVITAGILIAFMANSGCMTPAGSSCTAYITGPDSDITVGEGLKYNICMALIYTVIACVILIPIGIKLL